MLTHPTLDQLNQLGLFGMAKAFGEIVASGDAAALPHPDWLALLLDCEMSYRHDRKLTARLRYARLRHPAAVEDVVISHARSRRALIGFGLVRGHGPAGADCVDKIGHGRSGGST